MKNLTILLSLMFINGSALAEVVLDTSNGKILVPAVNDNITIEQEMGVTAGNNLFHSFDKFNVSRQENVIFNGSANINNVINRVSSSEVSIIDGGVVSNIDGANFWFLNPNGVLLGEQASFNISGSLNLTTANSISFSNGKTINADELEMFNDSEIVELHFNSDSGAIVIDQAQINTVTQGDVNLIGNTVNTYDALINSAEGKVSIISVNENTLNISDSGIEVGIEDYSAVNLIDSTIGKENTDDLAVNINGAEVVIDNTVINHFQGSSNEILIQAENAVFSDSVFNINANTNDSVVEIKSNNMLVTNGSILNFTNNSSSESLLNISTENDLTFNGNEHNNVTINADSLGANINITANDIEFNHAVIHSKGKIDIESNALINIDNSAISTNGGNDESGIIIQSSSDSESSNELLVMGNLESENENLSIVSGGVNILPRTLNNDAESSETPSSKESNLKNTGVSQDYNPSILNSLYTISELDKDEKNETKQLTTSFQSVKEIKMGSNKLKNSHNCLIVKNASPVVRYDNGNMQGVLDIGQYDKTASLIDMGIISCIN